MANTYISRTQANGTSSQKFTVSCWVKRSGLTSTQAIWGSGSATNDGCDLAMTGTDELTFESWDGSNNPKIITNRKFRDPSAWYHIVLAVDTTQATDTNRVKIYVNGVQETSFGTANYPSQNYNLAVSTTNDVMKFGVGGQYATSYWNGSMSHVHFVDGLQYAASDFGSTDSTTGEWKINTSPSVTYGTNGCFLLKDGNTITDSSSNSNNFALAQGTLTKTEDCPDNNFATMNPLDNYMANSTFTNGNLSITTVVGNDTFNNSTIGYSTGKFYWETKSIQASTSNYDQIGITSKGSLSSSEYMSNSLYSVVIKGNGTLFQNAGSGSGAVGGWSGSSYTTGDIIGIAHDATNNKIYIHKNGTYMNSGNPTTGANGITTTASSSTDTGFWLPAVGDEITSGTASQFALNFGNGYFGTTAISSAGSNASGNGIFEYDVPTGFTALSTKGLNE